MTETPAAGQNRPIPVPQDPAHITALVDSSIKPGASVFLVFNEGTLTVVLDRLGDWTISVVLTTKLSKLITAGPLLEDLGFFKAAEVDGKAYFLWTSALRALLDNRECAEDKLLEALKILQTAPRSSYIT